MTWRANWKTQRLYSQFRQVADSELVAGRYSHAVSLALICAMLSLRTLPGGQFSVFPRDPQPALLLVRVPGPFGQFLCLPGLCQELVPTLFGIHAATPELCPTYEATRAAQTRTIPSHTQTALTRSERGLWPARYRALEDSWRRAEAPLGAPNGPR